MTLDETCIRAFRHSFKAEKIFLCYPILFVSSLVICFVLAMLHSASDWVIFGAISVPVYLTLGLLASLSVFIHRIYYHELRGDSINYKDIFAASINRMLNGVFLSLPLMVTHLLLWVLLGVFFFLQDVPYLGTLVAVLFSMLPYAFLVVILGLPIFTVFVLFYGSCYFAFDLTVELEPLKEKPLTIFRNFFIGLLPLALAILFFGSIYWFTMDLFKIEENILALTLQRIFLLIPFSLYLSPFILFFFHFGLESYREVVKK
jgi:hypothetical protein